MIVETCSSCKHEAHCDENQSMQYECLKYSLWEHKDKPPIGIMRYKLWIEHRIKDLKEAMARYLEVNKSVNVKWIREYNWLIKLHEETEGLDFKVVDLK